MSGRKVAIEWSQRVAAVAHGHYRAALRYSTFQQWLGLPTVLLTTIVGTSVFATIQHRPEVMWQIIIGLMSIAAAVFSALQSFLNYNAKAEQHRSAGARYNAVGRELEQLLSQNDMSSLTEIRKKIDLLADESPHIPDAVQQEIAKIPVESIWKE